MDRDFDVFGAYRGITTKLRKRFMKKPNFAEASEGYGLLASTLKQQDCPQVRSLQTSEISISFCYSPNLRVKNIFDFPKKKSP